MDLHLKDRFALHRKPLSTALAVIVLLLSAAPLIADCQAGPTTLCLNGGRFRVEIAWKDFAGRTGAGHALPQTGDTGTASFSFTDEWYNFRADPRSAVNVLLALDESSYSPGGDAMGDHPIAWCHPLGLGRAWYTSLGHRSETYGDPSFSQHLLGGILWAAGRS